MRKYVFCLTAILLLLFMPSASADAGLTRQALCRTIIETMIHNHTIAPFGIQERPFTDTEDNFVLQAYALGLVAGDGTGCFRPDDLVTKEQAAVIFKRAQDYIVPRLIYDNTKVKEVQDRNSIADYAVTSVMLLTMTDTIDGGVFNPKDTVTQQYAADTMRRVYNTVSLPVSRPGQLPCENVPVLMYHLISDPADESSPYAYLYVNSNDFEAQVRYLSENGYTFLYPDELYYAAYCEKPVVLTFDDGHLDNYTTAFPILKKYNAKATVFVACNNIHADWMLTRQQIKELSDSGLINIGSHSLSHENLASLNDADLQEEMAGSQWLLETITGRKITNIAYPYGLYSAAVMDKAKRYFASGFSVLEGEQGNPYAISRRPVDRGISLEKFQQILK